MAKANPLDGGSNARRKLKRLPTPTASGRSGRNPKTGRGEGLEWVVKRLPDEYPADGSATPATSTSFRDVSTTMESGSAEAVASGRTPSGTNTGRAANGAAPEMWPTPCSRDHKDTGQNTNWQKIAAKGKLAGLVKMWPTPSANEDAAGRPGSKMQLMLGNHPEVRNDSDGNLLAGTLNPQFVSWLMGFPLDWCDMPDESPPGSRTE